MARNKEGLEKALELIPELEENLQKSENPGDANQVNQELEKANRLSDFFGLAALMCRDALNRKRIMRHFREEYQTDSGEALVKRREILRSGMGVYRRKKNPSYTRKISSMKMSN